MGFFDSDDGRQHESERAGGGEGDAPTTFRGVPGKRTLTEGMHGPPAPSGAGQVGQGGVSLPEGLRSNAGSETSPPAQGGSFGAEPTPGAASVGGAAGAGRAGGAGLRVHPVKFPRVRSGDEAVERLELENQSPRQLRIVNWSLGGDDAGDFEVQLPRLFDLSAHGRFWSEVRFRPESDGERNATLSIQTDEPANVRTVALTGGLADRRKGSSIAKEERRRPAVEPSGPGGNSNGQTWVDGSNVAYPRAPRSEAAAPPSPGHLPGAPARALSLSEDERAELISVTRTYIPLAFAGFWAACSRVSSAIKDAAKKEAEFTAMLIEVGVGLLAPGAVNGLSKIGDLIAAGDEPTKMASVVNFLRNRDLNKAYLAAAAKRTTTEIKMNATKVFAGANPDGYLDRLMVETQALFGGIAARLRSASDGELVATFGAFHPEVANLMTYVPLVEGLVRRFQAQVGAIASEHPEDTLGVPGVSVLHKTKVYQVRSVGEPLRLAILTRQLTATMLGSQRRFIFGSWVDDQFRESALARTRAIGETVETVEGSDVEF